MKAHFKSSLFQHPIAIFHCTRWIRCPLRSKFNNTSSDVLYVFIADFSSMEEVEKTDWLVETFMKWARRKTWLYDLEFCMIVGLLKISLIHFSLITEEMKSFWVCFFVPEAWTFPTAFLRYWDEVFALYLRHKIRCLEGSTFHKLCFSDLSIFCLLWTWKFWKNIVNSNFFFKATIKFYYLNWFQSKF